MTVFEQGDIVCLDLDPQAGHEPRGRQPALVVSGNLFNRVSSLTIVCSITHTDKGHPFHIRLDGAAKTDGVVLRDQARMLDLASRGASSTTRFLMRLNSFCRESGSRSGRSFL